MSEYSRSLFHYETDGDGVCHFSNYFRIAEEALFHALGDGGIRFAVLEAQSQNSQPLRQGDRFAVTFKLVEMRRSNFILAFSIQNDGISKTQLTIRFATIHPEKWEVISLPNELKEKLRKYDNSYPLV